LIPPRSDLKLMTFVPQLPQCWDYGSVPRHLDLKIIFKQWPNFKMILYFLGLALLSFLWGPWQFGHPSQVKAFWR
jgi:hypothetical protein